MSRLLTALFIALAGSPVLAQVGADNDDISESASVDQMRCQGGNCGAHVHTASLVPLDRAAAIQAADMIFGADSGPSAPVAPPPKTGK